MTSIARPVEGKITCTYEQSKERGSLTPGVSFAVPRGTDVRAAASGTVSAVIQKNSTLGNFLTIESDDSGWSYAYMHMDHITAKRGDHVNQGDILGRSGNTGQVTGPCLHFTMQDAASQYVNPERYFEIVVTKRERDLINEGDYWQEVTEDEARAIDKFVARFEKAGEFAGWGTPRNLLEFLRLEADRLSSGIPGDIND